MKEKEMTPGSSSSGLLLKKGAWSAEEDMLLKNCIEKYGEGNWHLIPLRSGLNRCRKGCRLRWLNYLRPNIKKGDFAEDEVDLIFRLHKLLGNRWSLIAGRIPGRTANDIKNFWNTHVEPRSKQHKTKPNAEDTISKTLDLSMSDNPLQIAPDGGGNLNRSSKDQGAHSNFNVSSLSPNVVDDSKIVNQYIDELFEDQEMEMEGDIGWSFGETSAQVEALNAVEQEFDDMNFFDFVLD